VMGSVAARDAQPGQPYVFSAGALRALASEAARQYPGQRVVGWYHSNPNRGVFLSAADVRTQNEAFTQSWHVGFVFDPLPGQGGFFGWIGNDLSRIATWEVTDVMIGADPSLPVVMDEPAPAPMPLPAADIGPSFAPAETEYSIGAPIPPVVPATPFPPAPTFDLPSPMSSGQVPVTPAFAPPDTGLPTEAAAVSPSALVPGPAPAKNPLVKWVALVVAIALVAVIVYVAFGSSDNKPSSATSTTASSVVPTTTTQPGSAPSTAPTSSNATTSSVASSGSTAPGQSTSTSTGGSVTPAATFPATPKAVTAPTTRVGNGATPCVPTTGSTYQPTSTCFVALNNGNIVADVGGALYCVDPGGKQLAAKVTSFTVGAPGDPIAIVADTKLLPSCVDLTYARNTLAKGATVFDGLCGASGTQINEATRRCMSQNTASGAMAAVVRGSTQTALGAFCTPSQGDSSSVKLTWSVAGVSTLWKIDGLSYDAASNQFTAHVSRSGTNATATFSCS